MGSQWAVLSESDVQEVDETALISQSLHPPSPPPPSQNMHQPSQRNPAKSPESLLLQLLPLPQLLI